jgi:myo-inositol 2-dehydrogenase/D-chiro-inositol 1-dehydrogenase
MSAYTGKTITWDDALNSKEVLAPTAPLTLDMKLPVPPVAMPGRTKFS